jgi:acetyltransferase-like isoleucine patch superfamily enzyme
MTNIFFELSELKYVGLNVIIGKTVRIRHPERVIIHDNVIIDDFTYISCGLEIHKNSHIASNVSISGGLGKLTIGECSTLSNHCSVHCASSDYKRKSNDLPSIPIENRTGGYIKDITIGNNVVVGAHCCILPGSVLPDNSAFGAYTLIDNSNLLQNHLYAGVKCQKDFGERE